MRRTIWAFVAALSLGACTTLPSTATNAPGVVSAADPRAAEAGATMLRQGGSATDAVLATLLALTVVEPQSSGIGGGGFLVASNARGSVTTFDGREEAPMSATPSLFLRNGKPMSAAEVIPGGTSVGVPGNIRMMAMAHQRHGKVEWKALFQPAIALARDGFVITPRLRGALDRNRAVAGFSTEARAIFYGADGEPFAVGTRVTNPRLAALLTDIAARGPDAFYVGPNARSVSAAVSNAPRNPAAMTPGDFAAYDAKPRASVCGSYRGHRICGMGPPSSGATTVFAILKQVERFNFAALGKDSPVSWHLFAESTRLAFADRDRFLADPDFVSVPVAGLTDPAYLAGRSALISPDRTMALVASGNPANAPQVALSPQPLEQGTSHFVATDRWGNAASLTSTIESQFGSGMMVNGYYLNNELTDFNAVPSIDGVPVANRVEASKRPRSSMAPTIVFGPDGRVRLAVGAAGGPTIIAQVAKSIIAVIDWRLSAPEAIALPVLFSPGDTLYVERGTAHEAMIPALRALGHAKIGHRDPGSFKANAIEWVANAQGGGRWVGAADSRSEGASVGE